MNIRPCERRENNGQRWSTQKESGESIAERQAGLYWSIKRFYQSWDIPMCVLSVSVAPYPRRAKVRLLLCYFTTTSAWFFSWKTTWPYPWGKFHHLTAIISIQCRSWRLLTITQTYFTPISHQGIITLTPGQECISRVTTYYVPQYIQSM